MKKTFTILITFFFFNANAQVGIGTTTPNAKAALDITDSTKGLLIPRMTMVKRNAIAAPPNGLMVYQTDSIKGFWYFDGTAWQNIHGSSNTNYYGGMHTIVLSDTITNAQAQQKIAAQFGPNTQEIRIAGCLNLSSVDLSMITTVTEIMVTDNPVLVTLNLGNLKTCDGSFSLRNCPALSNVNINSLQTIIYNSANELGAFYIQNTNLTTINVPKLRRILGMIFIDNNRHLQTLSFPALSEESSYMYITNNKQLSTVSFPVLTAVGAFKITQNNVLTILDMPSVTRFTNADYGRESYLQNCPNLTTFNLGSLTEFNNLGFENFNTKLSSEGVNSLLHNFASIVPPLNGHTIKLPQTPDAPPTGQGIVDKNTLISNNNQVLTN
jgi:hypothetical protein